MQVVLDTYLYKVVDVVNYIDFVYSSCYFLICLGDSNWGGKQAWRQLLADEKKVCFFVSTSSNCNHQSRHEKIINTYQSAYYYYYMEK